jgi:hypothetical protein
VCWQAYHVMTSTFRRLLLACSLVANSRRFQTSQLEVETCFEIEKVRHGGRSTVVSGVHIGLEIHWGRRRPNGSVLKIKKIASSPPHGAVGFVGGRAVRETECDSFPNFLVSGSCRALLVKPERGQTGACGDGTDVYIDAEYAILVKRGSKPRRKSGNDRVIENLDVGCNTGCDGRGQHVDVGRQGDAKDRLTCIRRTVSLGGSLQTELPRDRGLRCP